MNEMINLLRYSNFSKKPVSIIALCDLRLAHDVDQTSMFARTQNFANLIGRYNVKRTTDKAKKNKYGNEALIKNKLNEMKTYGLLFHLFPWYFFHTYSRIM